MGRPIQKKWFGDPASIGYQLRVTAKLPGEAAAEGFIIEQTGTRKYKVNVNGTIGDVYLINETNSGNLNDGEGFMTATPFNGSSQPVYKLTQYRVSVYDSPNGFSTYSWSSADAAAADEATIDSISGDTSITYETATATATLAADAVDSITVDTKGQGYLQVPEVTFSGGDGSGAAATAVLVDGQVDSITVDNGGSGYTSAPTVTIESPEDANA